MRVAWGADFEARLGQALLQLALDRGLRRRIGDKARDFIERNHRLDITVAGYKKAIAAAQAIAPPQWATTAPREFLPPHRLADVVRAARAAGATPALPLWFEVGAVPVCGSVAPRMLVVGGDGSDAALLQLLGHARDAACTSHVAAIDTDDLAAPLWRTADLAIVHWDEAMAGRDPSVALAWLNRHLAFGGTMVWSAATTNDTTRRGGQRAAAAPLFEAYGFRIEAAFTGSPAQIDDPPEDSGMGLVEERCWRAVKVSETFADPAFALEMRTASAAPVAAGPAP